MSALIPRKAAQRNKLRDRRQWDLRPGPRGPTGGTARGLPPPCLICICKAAGRGAAPTAGRGQAGGTGAATGPWERRETGPLWGLTRVGSGGGGGGVLLLLPPGSGCWRGADHHFRWVFLRGFTARTSLCPPRPAPMQGVLSDRSSMPQPDPSDAGKGAASLTAPLPSVGLGMAHVALPLPHPGYTCPQRGRDLIPLSASLGERSQRNPNCIITLASPICLNNPP